MNRYFGTIGSHLWLSGLLACVGCWEEVHYEPNRPSLVTPVNDDSTSPEFGPSPTEVLSADIEDSESAEVTANELFSTSHDERVQPDETPPNTSEAIPEDSQTPRDFQPDEPVTVEAPDLDIEQPKMPESKEPSQEADVSMSTEQSASTEFAAAEESDTPTVEVLRPSRTALAVWRMSSRWSMAAAIYAKGEPEDRYGNVLDQAAYAADLVGIELPAFPTNEGIDLEATIISYLLDRDTATFVTGLSAEYLPEFKPLAELAIRTNALLLVYTPKSDRLDPLVTSIRQSAESSGLPVELWSDLISMLERREPFNDVKHRVLAFHGEVGDYLAGSEKPRPH